jgi:pimeloyl-ACP methyl ester carboxylesterase
VRLPLYSPVLSSALPEALHQAAQGRWEPLLALGSSLGPRGSGKMAGGMHFSVVCAEDVPRLAMSTDAPGRDFGRFAAGMYERICADWPRGEVPAAFYTIPRSATAALVLSGGADPVTPPRHGARVAQALGNKARHVVVPQAGHGVMSLPCMRDVLHRFVDADTDEQALAEDGACAVGIPRPLSFAPPSAASAAASGGSR